MAAVPSDIEIAQAAKPKPIVEVAAKLGIAEDDLEQYGKHKAKVAPGVLKGLSGKLDGKLILVTAITPTPAGEGKTTTSVGLTDGLNKIGKKACVALREPSLGPASASRAVRAAASWRRRSSRPARNLPTSSSCTTRS